MKNTSKFYAFAAMIVAAAACLCSFASCNKAGEIVETDREEGTTAMYYSIGLSAWVGAGMGVDYEGCAITVSNRSEEGTLFIEKLEGEKYCTDWERLSSYPSAESFDKRALHGETPLTFENRAFFQWMPLNDWSGLTSDDRVEDYVAFTAEKDGQIAGYTVMYVSGDHFEAQSSVVANREFPKVKGNYQNVSREWLNQRIETVIKEHRESL